MWSTVLYYSASLTIYYLGSCIASQQNVCVRACVYVGHPREHDYIHAPSFHANTGLSFGTRTTSQVAAFPHVNMRSDNIPLVAEFELTYSSNSERQHQKIY